MGSKNLFKPNKQFWLLVLSYGLPALFLSLYIVISAGMLLVLVVENTVFFPLLKSFGWPIFIICWVVTVYLIICLLRQWLARYTGKRTWWWINSIGAALSVIVIFLPLFLASQTPRTKSRDARVLADVKLMQTALELYFYEAGEYPGWVKEGGDIEYQDRIFMDEVPFHPASKKICPKDMAYFYQAREGRQSYTIKYCLEGDMSGVPKGLNFATSGTISTRINN